MLHPSGGHSVIRATCQFISLVVAAVMRAFYIRDSRFYSHCRRCICKKPLLLSCCDDLVALAFCLRRSHGQVITTALLPAKLLWWLIVLDCPTEL